MPDLCNFGTTGRPAVREWWIMKKDIHPKYQKAIITCACGNSFETRATQSEIKVDICNACHPFYTGKQKIVDTAGRVEKFRQRYGMK